MIRLNDDGVAVGYIKSILHGFELPSCKVIKDGDSPSLGIGEPFIKGGFIYVNEEGGPRRVRPYKWGDRVHGITKNMRLDGMTYDYHTHEYLGEYLRFLRDYRGIDLMGMYNCFDYFSPSGVEFEADGTKFSSYDDTHVLYCFPAKFGEKYNIFVDWLGEIDYCFAYYSSGSVVTPLSGTKGVLHGSTFESPSYVFAPAWEPTTTTNPDTEEEETTPAHPQYDWTKANELKMFVSIPKAHKSSVVVLEGVYHALKAIVRDYAEVLGDALFEYIPLIEARRSGKDHRIQYIWGDLTGNYDYNCKHQLTIADYDDKNLLADRLLEYLSNQAITGADPVVHNVKRLQKTLKETDGAGYEGPVDGIWNDDMRKAMYRYVCNGSADGESLLIDEKYDVISFCDKDMERKLGYLKRIDEYEGGN